MNIEIANRLAKLRKEKGYSQEELAEKLGLSRQAVSKWERAESSPDTDNLICLAKLYNISLDELLRTEEDVESIKETVKEKEESKNKTVKITTNGIHVKDDEVEVDVSLRGIYVKDYTEGKEVVLGSKPFSKLSEKEQRNRKIIGKIDSIYSIVVVAAYIILGAVFEWWHPGWLLFLTIPLVSSAVEAIINKNAKNFDFPFLAALVFFILGFEFNLWHPGWVVFILIPVYYSVVPGKINTKIHVIQDDINNEDLDEEELDEEDN